MIDRNSRDRLALGLRRYVSGRISNDDLDVVRVDWRDRGAVAIKEMAWALYDDNYNHRAIGRHALHKEGKREIAKWILFLHSDREYLWPEYTFIQIYNWPLNLLTFGWWERQKMHHFQEFCEAGDFSCWPFLTARELAEARATPRFLVRRAAQA
jgi:hypothetical protein